MGPISRAICYAIGYTFADVVKIGLGVLWALWVVGVWKPFG